VRGGLGGEEASISAGGPNYTIGKERGYLHQTQGKEETPKKGLRDVIELSLDTLKGGDKDGGPDLLRGKKGNIKKRNKIPLSRRKISKRGNFCNGREQGIWHFRRRGCYFIFTKGAQLQGGSKSKEDGLKKEKFSKR